MSMQIRTSAKAVILCDYLGKAENAALYSDTNQVGFGWLDLSILNRLPLFPSKLRRSIMNFYEGKEYTKYLVHYPVQSEQNNEQVAFNDYGDKELMKGFVQIEWL